MNLYPARVKGVIALFVLNGLDLVLTYWALALGASEGNPLAVWLIETKMGIVLKLGICLIAVAGLYVRPKTTVLQLCATWFTVGIYALVCVLNAATIIICLR